MEILNKIEKNIYLSYVPHGINHDNFKPVEVPVEFKKKFFGDAEYDLVLLWSNRNIRRKQPGDVIYSYKMFCDLIGDAAKRVVLIMHTTPVDDNGTNLHAVATDLAPECNIIFSDSKLSTLDLNYLYNISDITLNLSDAEGFGLSTAESVMAGTPILINVTGGLQDQCGFKLNGEYLSPDDYIKLQTLSGGNKIHNQLTHGEWVFPVFSDAHSIVGSVPTPYIYEDRLNLRDVANTLCQIHTIGREGLKRRGLIGRNAFIDELGLTADNMCRGMIDSIETIIENWKPQQKFEIYKIN